MPGILRLNDGHGGYTWEAISHAGVTEFSFMTATNKKSFSLILFVYDRNGKSHTIHEFAKDQKSNAMHHARYIMYHNIEVIPQSQRTPEDGDYYTGY